MPHLITNSSNNSNNNKNFNYNDVIKLKRDRIFADNSPFSWWLTAGQTKLPPEIERDNVEYKWKLTGMSEERRVHLVTQMRWRVGELGYCWYILGVKDNGDLEGISEEDLQATLTVLRDLVTRANLSIELIQPVSLPFNGRLICQVRIELEASEQFSTLDLQPQRNRETRVLFLGATGSGKTTLLSVLGDWGSRDDGRGKMRTRLLHHRHELLSGTTSSVTHQPLVYLNDPIPLALTDDTTLLQLERRKEILSEGKVVQLIDSAGKLRFNRTVFSVLTSAAHPPDLAFIVLEAPGDSQATFPPQTIETLRLLDGLGVPLAVLVSKIDRSSTEAISLLLEEFSTLIGDKNLSIYSEESKSFTNDEIPVLLTSAVNGDFLSSLSHFLYHRTQNTNAPSVYNCGFVYAKESATCALIIEQVAHPAEVGTVVYGQVAFGIIWVGDEMVLGPCERGSDEIIRVRVKSIQRLKCPVNSASKTQHVSLALQFLTNYPSTSIRKGMAVLKLRPDSLLTLKPLKRIIAEVEQVCGGSAMRQRFSGVLFVMGQRFTATLDLTRRARSSIENPPTTKSKSVCIVTFNEKRPATVFLFPTASIIFIGNGSKETFVGKVIDYFA